MGFPISSIKSDKLFGTYEEPYVMGSSKDGSGSDSSVGPWTYTAPESDPKQAKNDTWHRNRPPTNASSVVTDGVKLDLERIFIEATSSSATSYRKYTFTRTAIFDSAGLLVSISAETLEATETDSGSGTGDRGYLMIDTVIFSWKNRYPEQTISLFDCILWCGSVNYAKKHFKNIVFVGDKPSQEIFGNKLDLPFTEILDLPDIPNELGHIYALPKLHANYIMAKRGAHALQVDYDAFLKKKLPESFLNAEFVGEFFYPTKNFAELINNQLLPRRLDRIEFGVSAGIFGGCDTEKIIKWTEKSINSLTDLSNREFLKNYYNGYQISALMEEMAVSEFFTKDQIKVILPRGMDYVDDYRRAGFMHFMSLKDKNNGVMAQAALQVQMSFPKEYASIGEKYESLY